MSLRSRLLLGTFLIGMGPLTPLSLAAEPAGAAGVDGGEEVIVTATKRARNVQDVPISIQVVDQKSLEQSGTSDLLTLSSKVPALIVNTSNGGNLLRIRGIGSDVVPHYEQSVALYRDGIFMAKARQNQAPFFDVLRIEILRGPQGALIGKNSSAGAVNIVSNNPTDDFEAGLTANYLFDKDGVDIFGYVSGPVSEQLSARIALKYKDVKGPLENFATGGEEPDSETIQGRITLHFEPSESVDMVTKFEYIHQDSTGHIFAGVPLTLSYEQARDQIVDGGGYAAPILTVAKPDGTVLRLGNGDQHEQYDFSNLLTIDAEGLTFVSLSGFTGYQSVMATTGRHAAPYETLSTTYYEDFKQVSQEFRLQSPVGQTFEWVVGLYGDWSELSYQNPVITDLKTAVGGILSRAGTRTDYQMTAYSFSIFGTGTWHVSDALDLVIGGRYTSVHKSGYLENIRDFLSAGVYTAAPFKYEGSLTDDHFDPSLTLQYQVTPEVMVYASYGQGSKPGTFQSARSTTPTDFRLKQEITTSYEIGIKSELGGFMTLNASAYYMTMDDFQVSQYITDQNGLPVLRATNAATAISQGVEVSATANLDEWVEGLRLSFSGAYNDAYFDDYPGASCTAAAAAAGCVNGQPFQNGQLFNGKGLQLNNVSEWSGTLGFDYAGAISDTLELQASGSLNMFSGYWFDNNQYDERTGRQPGETMVNLRLGIGDLDGKWSLAIVGENLTDVWKGGQAYLFPGFPGSVRVYGIYGGRNVMLQAGLKF
ncbi:Vitamin B12 transporter BtuB [Alphaproteobacteria bacterium SO-S41]|nr:Vitamin B12 transporter BtuB [Alphaproteobacteria bacterium SO-S41]